MTTIINDNIAFHFCRNCGTGVWYDKTELINFIQGYGIVCPVCGREIIVEFYKDDSNAPMA